MSKNIDIIRPGFRERFVDLREATGCTKSEFAARAGISYRTVHDIETGQRTRVQEKTLRLAAQAMGIAYEELVNGIPDPPPGVRKPAAREPGAAPVPPRRLSSRRSTALIPVVVVFALAGVGFGVNYFAAGPEVSDGALSVAVTCFEHRGDGGDPRHLGMIARDLVINGLSESRYVRVISPPSPDPLDRDAAARAGADWLLLGSILQEQPRLVMTSRLEDTRDGTVMATQSVTAADGETLFDVAARLAAEVKRDLVLPRGQSTEKGLPIARVTTRSVRAYRHYVEGVENLKKLYRADARAELRRAVAQDSTFAMARVMLVHPEICGPRAERDSLIVTARRHAAGLTPRERHYMDAFAAFSEGDLEAAIVACEALVAAYPQESQAYRLLGRFYNSLGDEVASVSALETAVEVDPFDGMSLNRLAYMHAAFKEYDDAFRRVGEYIRLAPAEANPYDTRGDLLAWTGSPEEAVASYRQALDRNPTFFPSMQNLGVMLTLLRRYDEAEGYFRRLLDSEDPGARSRGRWFLAMMEVYQGRLDRAEVALHQAMAADRLEQVYNSNYAHKLCALAQIQCERGDHDAAAATYAEALAVVDSHHPERMQLWPAGYVEVLSRFDIAAATEYQGQLEERRLATEQENTRVYWASLGWIQLRTGDADAACVSFEKAVEERDRFDLRYPLGLAYLEAQRYDDAVRTFEGTAHTYSTARLQHAIWGVKLYYQLARAYEGAGRAADARRWYDEFLSIWGDAPIACDEVEDAGERVTALARDI